MSRIDDWNQRHRSADAAPREPAPIVVEASGLVRHGRALDLACGAGRNAIYLAERGWKVAAVDAAIEALRRIQNVGPEPAPSAVEGTPAAIIADLEREGLPFKDASFDLVINILFLHRPLFEEIRRVVNPGGIFAAQIHIRGINPSFCVAPGELRTRFEEWEVVEYRESETAELIARKR